MSALPMVVNEALVDARGQLVEAPGDRAAAPVPAVPAYRAQQRPVAQGWSGVFIGLWLLLWWALTAWQVVPPLFLPAPHAVVQALQQAWQGELQGGESLWVHTLWSAVRVLLAFGLAMLTAIPVGLAMGVSAWAQRALDPLLEFYRPLPPLAYLPLVVIWLGIDEGAKVLLIYLACFAPIALATRAGTQQASAEQRHAARSLGATPAQVVWHVVIPAALPQVFVGLRIAMGFAWTTLVAAEMVAATQGLGQMVLNASNFLRTDVVVMGIFVIGLIALALDAVLRWLERRLLPWHVVP